MGPIFKLVNTLLVVRFAVLFVSFTSLSPAFLKGQDLLFDQLPTYTTQKGISQNSVFDIVQDSFGFMWFATQTGLNRYDGQRFEHYKYSKSDTSTITKGYVTALCVTDSGLWVGTEAGLSRLNFDPVTRDFQVQRIGEGKGVKKIVAYQAGEVLVATEHDIYVASPESIAIVCEFGRSSAINDIVYLDKEERVIIGKEDGLYQLDIQNPEDAKESKIRMGTEGSRKVTALYYLHEEELLLVGQTNRAMFGRIKDGRFRRNGDLINPWEFGKDRNMRISAFLKSKNNHIWIGTEQSGIFYKDHMDSEPKVVQRKLHQPFGLSSNLILSLYESRDGVIWIGTNGGGVNKYSEIKQHFHHTHQDFVTPQDVPFNNDVWAFYQTESYLYVGTDGNGVARYLLDKLHNDKKEGVTKWLQHVSRQKDRNTVYAIDRSTKSISVLLLGTEDGLYIVHNGDSVYTEDDRVASIPRGAIVSAFKTELSGGRYLVGTSKKGFFVLNENLDQIRSFPSLKGVNVIIKGRKEREFFLGTDTGLYQLNLPPFGPPKKGDLFKLDNEKLEGTIFKSLSLIDQSDTLLIGSGGEGLILYDLKQDRILSQFTTQNKLPDDVIYGVLIDYQKDIWISTNEGISRINLEGNTINNYQLDDGLQQLEFNRGAFAKGKYGRTKNKQWEILYFGGVNGMNWFIPVDRKRMNTQTESPQLAYKISKTDNTGFQSYLVLGKADENIEIPFEGRAIKVEVAVLDYHDPQNNSLRTKFRNDSLKAQNNWVPISGNEIEITGNSLSGDYILEEGKNFLGLNYRQSYRSWEAKNQIDLIAEVAPSITGVQVNNLQKDNKNLIGAIIAAIIAVVFGLWQARSARSKTKELEIANRGSKEKNKELKILKEELEHENKNLAFLHGKLTKKHTELSQANAQLHALKDKLEYDYSHLDNLHQIINEITRKEKTKEIFNLATQHLTVVHPFNFDYAIVHVINRYKRKIEWQYHSPDKGMISPKTEDWRNSTKAGEKAVELIPNDILEVVFDDQKLIVRVTGKAVEVLEGDKKKEKIIQLDPVIFKAMNHMELDRLFLPIVRRSKEIRGRQEGDFTFGVLEVGFHRDTVDRSVFDEHLLINLKLYLDNCAQVYQRAFFQESRIEHRGLVDKHYVERDQQLYLKKILSDLVDAFDCDMGDIALATYNERRNIWVPSLDESITYKIPPEKLKAIRSRSLQNGQAHKKGIYRHAFSTRKYYYSGDVNKDPYYLTGLDVINSQLAVPLQSYGKYVGVINLYSKEFNYFDEFKARNLEYLANVFTDIYLRKKANNILNSLLQPLNIYLDRESIHQKIINLVKLYFLTDHVLIEEYLDSEVGEEIQQTVVGKKSSSRIQLFPKAAFESIQLNAALIEENNEDFQSVIIAPIDFGKVNYGHIVILSRRKIERLFPEDEIFINQVADKCSMSIHSAELFNTFHQMSDPFAEGNADAIFHKITKSTKKIFESDVAILQRIIQGKPYNLANGIRTGELFYPISEKDAAKDIISKGGTIIDYVLEDGTLFISTEEEYQALIKNRKRKWLSHRWEKDFYYREKIKSFAATRLEHEGRVLGVLFLNYRKEKRVFDEEFKNLFSTFIRLSTKAIVNAELLEENRGFKERNIRLTRPVVEGTIISGLAHNTGNLVNSLLRRFDEFQNDIKKVRSDSISKELVDENIKMIAAPLKQLNTDYLKLRTFRRTEEKVQFEEVRLKNLLENIVSLIKGRATRKNIKIELNIAANPLIKCDINYMEHALLNLLINAIEAIKANYGGKIRIQTSLDKKKQYVSIQVIDNGPGIRKEEYDKIFQSYYTSKKEGTGIGLPISKYIVEKVHKGKLDFSSVYREGAKFSITLPVLK